MITKGLGSGVCLMVKGMGILWKFGTYLLSLLPRSLFFNLEGHREKMFRVKAREFTMTLENRFLVFNLIPRSTMFTLEVL